MVFIDKFRDIIKLFENSSRREIGISLLAYEEFISKGLKVNDEDLEKLTEVFDYYDEEFSDNYPSLTNVVLQNSDILICNYLNNNNTKGYLKYTLSEEIEINLAGRSENGTSFNVEITDKQTGSFEDEINYNVKDKFINSDYGKDSFNTIFKAYKEVQKQIEKTDLKSMLNNYKI